MESFGWTFKCEISKTQFCVQGSTLGSVLGVDYHYWINMYADDLC